MKSRKNARAALQRLLKRVRNFSEQTDIPVVLMTMVKGEFLVDGSAGLKGAAFGQNKVVRDSFIRASQIVNPVEPVEERNFQAGSLEETLLQLPNISVPVLRCVIANAMSPSGRQGRQSVYLGDRPTWWPDHVPFNSPNHPNGRTRALGRKDFLEIAYSLATHMGIDVIGDGDDPEDDMCDDEEPEYEEAESEEPESKEPESEEPESEEEQETVGTDPLPAHEVLGLLRMLEAASIQGGWENFCGALAKMPEVVLPRRGSFFTGDVNCAIDTRFSERLYFVDGVRLYPMMCTGNGNCLFNAGSIISYGSEDYNLHLRLTTMKAGVDSFDDIIRVLRTQYPHPEDAMAYGTEVLNNIDGLVMGTTDEILAHIVRAGIMATAKNHGYSGMLQIQLLAYAMKRPVHVFLDTQMELKYQYPADVQAPSMGILWCSATSKSTQISHFEPMLPVSGEISTLDEVRGIYESVKLILDEPTVVQ